MTLRVFGKLCPISRRARLYAVPTNFFGAVKNCDLQNLIFVSPIGSPLPQGSLSEHLNDPECVLKICLQVRFGSQQNHKSGLN